MKGFVNSDIEIAIENIENQIRIMSQSRALVDISLSHICDSIIDNNLLNQKSDRSLDEIFKKLSPADASRLCRMIYQKMLDDGCFDNRFGGNIEEHERICYLKSAYSDEAYECFSGGFVQAFCEYHDSFDEVCASLVNNSCSACILPTATGEGGMMMRIYALAEKYELKKSAVCQVQSGNDSFTEFSLFRKELTISGEENNIEIAFVPEKGRELGVLLSCAEELGLSIESVVTLPEDLASSGDEHCIILSNQDGFEISEDENSDELSLGIGAFILLIRFFFPRARLIGAWI